MYLIIVVAFMLVLPAACVAGETALTTAPLSIALVAKWFVTSAVGVRLALAGLRQVIQPRYTAHVIFAFKGEESLPVVRELGFANLAIGLMGIASGFFGSWRPAAAFAGAVFYTLAGGLHLVQPRRTTLEDIALASDLWAAGLLLACLPTLLH